MGEALETLDWVVRGGGQGGGLRSSEHTHTQLTFLVGSFLLDVKEGVTNTGVVNVILAERNILFFCFLPISFGGHGAQFGIGGRCPLEPSTAAPQCEFSLISSWCDPPRLSAAF